MVRFGKVFRKLENFRSHEFFGQRIHGSELDDIPNMYPLIQYTSLPHRLNETMQNTLKFTVPSQFLQNVNYFNEMNKVL